MKTQIIQLTFYTDNSIVFVNIANITHFSSEGSYTSVWFSDHYITVKETPTEILTRIV